MVMENRPVDPGSIQGSHRPMSFIRIKNIKHARTIFLCNFMFFILITEYLVVIIIP